MHALRRRGFLCCTGRTDAAYTAVDTDAREGNAVLDRARKKQLDEQKWNVAFEDQGSMYDFALLALIVRVNHLGTKCQKFMKVLSISIVLLFATGVQLTVISKVYDVVREEDREESRIFGGIGYNDKAMAAACHRLEGGSPFLTTISSTHDLVQCGLMAVNLLAENASILDINRDGFFTLSEAVELSEAWQASFNQAASPEGLYNFFTQKLSNKDRGVSSVPGDGALISMSAVLDHQWLLRLCSGWMPELCGNYEVRGVLQGGPFDAANFSASDRINLCSKVIQEYCPFIYGPPFRYYVALRKEMCGSLHYQWDRARRLLTITYASYELYVRGQQSMDPVASEFFELFLWFLIIIWCLSMLVEARALADWWVVLLSMPRAPDGEEMIEKHDGYMRITALDLRTKLYTVIFHLVPRSLICFFLLYVGIKFLSGTTNSQDLILNCVALGFLLEIDELCFQAVVGPTDTCIHAGIEDRRMYAESPFFVNFHRLRRTLPTEVTLSVLVLVLSAHYVRKAFDGTTGKYASADRMACLCQVEGEDCTEALILGGNTTLFRDVVTVHSPVTTMLSRVGVSVSHFLSFFVPPFL